MITAIVLIKTAQGLYEALQLGALRRRHIRSPPQGLERRALLRVLVEAQGPAAARHDRKPLHPGHYAPDQRDIAIQVSRGLA